VRPLARTGGWLLVALLTLAGLSSLTVVDVTEHAVVTRFGRVTRVIDEAGLHVTLPYPLEEVRRLDRRLLTFASTSAEYLSEDKKNLVVHGLVTWRIAAPERFLAALGDRAAAEHRLNDLVLARLGAVVGSYPSTALVSVGTRRSEFDAVVRRVVAEARATAQSVYGVDLVDVWIRQIGLPEQNRVNVFARMQAERGKIATQYRSEGEREFKKVIAEADRERSRIMAEAYREAERTKAEGDAQAMRIYAESYGKNPQFYKFARTLLAYEKLLDANTTVFLPADAEIFQILHGRPAPKGGK
jgi:membrane protease subunit HflC